MGTSLHLRNEHSISPLKWAHHNACVIDENIQTTGNASKFRRAMADGRERRKIEGQHVQLGVDPEGVRGAGISILKIRTNPNQSPDTSACENACDLPLNMRQFFENHATNILGFLYISAGDVNCGASGKQLLGRF